MPLEVLDVRSQSDVTQIVRRHGGWDRPDLAKAARDVQAILADVRERGDEALVDTVRRFHGAELTPATIRVSLRERDAGAARAGSKVREALEAAAANIRAYHEAQRPDDWTFDREGAVMGQIFRPIRRVGLYAPGGRAPLPSTVLMLAVPALVAGVRSIALCTSPSQDGECADAVLCAAAVCGIEEIYRVSGPAAVAALAYGTQTIESCDKVCGPGSIYTTLAKREVYGAVGIDGFFGPSESVVVAEGDVKPSWAAAELITQAEHDPEAAAVLVTTSEELMGATLGEVERRVQRLPLAKDIREALATHGLAVLVRDLRQAADVVNALAPEHLCLHVEDPDAFLDLVQVSGTVLVGSEVPATLSDYCAGPSHVLPTARAARFSSGVSVLDFMVAINTVRYTRQALFRDAAVADVIAEAEGLQAHRESLHARLEEP